MAQNGSTLHTHRSPILPNHPIEPPSYQISVKIILFLTTQIRTPITIFLLAHLHLNLTPLSNVLNTTLLLQPLHSQNQI